MTEKITPPEIPERFMDSLKIITKIFGDYLTGWANNHPEVLIGVPKIQAIDPNTISLESLNKGL